MPFRCLAAVALLTAPAALPAADDPLDAFPADAGAVLRLGSPTELTTKAKAFLNQAAPQFALLADQLGPGIGSLIGNPTLAGVDATSDVYVAVFPRPEKRPSVVFAVRTADSAALKKAIGQGYGSADYEDWVVYSLDAETVKAVQALIGGEGTAVRGSIPESLGPSFRDGEFAAFLNVPALRDAYRQQIDEVRRRLADKAGTETEPAAQAGLDGSRHLLETLLTAVEDASAVAGHIAIADDALLSQAVAVVKPDSASARFLAKQAPSGFPLLAKLPQARLAYFAVAGDLGELVAASARTSLKTHAEYGQLQKPLEELQKFHFSEIVGVFDFGDVESGVYRSISLTKVDRPEEFLGVVRELVKTMGEVEADGLQQDVALQPDAETVEGIKVDVITVSTTASDPNDEQAAAAQRLLKTLFGKDGLTERIAVVDGLFLQTTGDGTMETAIKAIRGESSGDETVQAAAKATRSALGEQSNLLVIVDLPRLLGGGLQLAVEAGTLPLPIDPKAIEDVDLAPSYTGVGAVAAKNEVRLRGKMPASQVGGLVDLLMVLQKAAPRRNQAE
ncbi:MAG: hypothetical protein WBC44_02570 [Planctomycetaceae bacterium]